MANPCVGVLLFVQILFLTTTQKQPICAVCHSVESPSTSLLSCDACNLEFCTTCAFVDVCQKRSCSKQLCSQCASKGQCKGCKDRPVPPGAARTDHSLLSSSLLNVVAREGGLVARAARSAPGLGASGSSAAGGSAPPVERGRQMMSSAPAGFPFASPFASHFANPLELGPLAAPGAELAAVEASKKKKTAKKEEAKQKSGGENTGKAKDAKSGKQGKEPKEAAGDQGGKGKGKGKGKEKM
mmetsp:Transcript_16667/g.26735  ORF Transcript_16667/g.26735 Transcript_16667/m.26735 type:complete len:241 (-) Transcript_16667:1117-1839(-)